MKFIYPAYFYEYKDGDYVVEFPDFFCTMTQGKSLDHAYEMAKEVLLIRIIDELENNKLLPKPSNIDEMKPKKNDDEDCIRSFTSLVEVSITNSDTDMFKNIKKTVVLPSWLNYEAERQNINFSQTLQEALRKKILV